MSHPNRRWSWLVVFAAVCAGAPGAFAQGVTGSAVTGTVTDPAGGPVPEASVQLRNTTNGAIFDAVTNAAGKYTLDNVPAGGPYTLTVQGGIYVPVSREGLLLRLGVRLTADVKLQTVMAEAVEITVNNDALDDKHRTGPSTRVTETTINKIPLQGRNFTDLQNIDPRVSGGSFAGQNSKFNNIQIDGGANNDMFGLASNGTPGGQSGAKALSLEAVKEFVIQVAPFDVRQGNFAGGLVNAITKSGTNEFHGSVFGYYQGRSLANQNAWQGCGKDASGNAIFDNCADTSFLDYTTLQYGASVGGPILKDKAQFFMALDLQTKSQSFGNSFQIGGSDPVSDLAKAGFTASVAQKFQSILLNKYGISQGDALAPSLSTPDRNFFAKITTSVIDNSQLELSYNLVSANSDILGRAPTSPSSPGRLRDGYQLSGAGYGQANTTNTGRVKLTTNWDGGRLSNELLAGVSIIRDARNLSQNLPLILVKATCSDTTVCPAGSGKIGASDSWLAAGGERFSQANVLDQDVYQLQDNLTWSVGNHRLTFGTSNEYFIFRNLFLQAATGVWAFNNLDDFEAGTAIAFERRFNASALQDGGTAKFGVTQLGAYVQDDWQPLANVTITPGFRVDLPIPQVGKTNPALVNNPALPIDTGKIPQYNPLWSPRVGFNWDVDGASNTVVRGGVGLFAGRPPYVWLSNAYSINGLSQVQVTCSGATGVPKFTADPNAQPYSCSGGSTPAAPTNQGEIDYFDPGTKYPQNFRAALGADRRLPFGIIASADFLFTKDVNGWYVTEENLKNVGSSRGEGRALYGTFAATGPAFRATPTRLDTTNLNQAVKVSNESDGYVTNLTFQAAKQFQAGYGVSVGYTYSQSRDTMSLTSSQALSNFQFAPIDGSIASRNLAPSAFDRPHRLVVTATAQLPYDLGVALSYSGQSGLPYTWTVNGDVNGDGINGNDLVYVPKTSADISLADPTQWAALDTFISSQGCLNDARGGFVKRGACRNPWQDYLDLRLSWTSPKLSGEQRIEVQWDIFNVLNLVNSRWGHLNQVANFETANSQFLRAAPGYDTTNDRPFYTFAAPSTLTSTVYSATASRWRMQLGARYVF